MEFVIVKFETNVTKPRRNESRKKERKKERKKKKELTTEIAGGDISSARR